MARIMAFIDGENLVLRYQAMLDEGKKPIGSGDKIDVVHQPNVYVWHPLTLKLNSEQVIRATYYTYATGNAKIINKYEDSSKKLVFRTHYSVQRPRTLQPKVFWKPKRSAKAKGVDIQMTVDMLTNAYRDNMDVAYLVSGDGDFIPLIEEVMRMGKQVYVAAFTNGLNPKLKTVADEFMALDPIYFAN